MSEHTCEFQADYGYNINCIVCGEIPEDVIKRYKQALEDIVRAKDGTADRLREIAANATEKEALKESESDGN